MDLIRMCDAKDLDGTCRSVIHILLAAHSCLSCAPPGIEAELERAI